MEKTSQRGKERRKETWDYHRERGFFLYIYRRYINERVAQYLFFLLPEIFVCVRLCEREREGEKKCMWIYKRMERVTFPSSIDPCVCVYISISFGRKWPSVTLLTSSSSSTKQNRELTKATTGNCAASRRRISRRIRRPAAAAANWAEQRRRRRRRKNLFLTDSIVPS